MDFLSLFLVDKTILTNWLDMLKLQVLRH